MDFLDELGNFKQKKILHFKMLIFFTFYSNGPNDNYGDFYQPRRWSYQILT